MEHKYLFRFVAVVVTVAFITSDGCKKSGDWSDTSAHKSSFVTANGVRLNYLDWGGSGPVLILIHGYDDNPHIFDDLAPAFTDHFRVVAYARRGEGDSEAKEPYDTATRTEDLRALMDSLGIAKADLVGHSLGGNEITAMAGSHPERVGRIVYLDAGYDWADPVFAAAFKKAPFDIEPAPEALKSLDAYHAFWKIWFPGVDDMSRVEPFIRDLVIVQPDGSIKFRASESAGQSLMRALLSDRRDYSKVHVPSLAIYADTFTDVQHGDPAQRAKNLDWEKAYMGPFREASIERVGRELPGAKIITVSGTHMAFFYTNREQVVTAMRSFLGVPLPRQ